MSNASLAFSVATEDSPSNTANHPHWANWQEQLEKLDFAFQPIVHIHSGELYAVEALLRKTDQIGFGSPFALFDALVNDGLLYPADLFLRNKA